jgi:hypothetical protein
VTTLSAWPRQLLIFSPGRPGLTICVLLTVILGLVFTRASASDLSSQKKGNNKPYAVIFGTVWGPDDKPVYGVKVKIRRENEKKARWEVYSDHHGEFAQRVPAGKGDYVAWADLKGNKASVSVHVDYDERVDTGIHLK